MAGVTNPFAVPIQPVAASDEELARFLQEAELPAVVPALAALTGNLSLLDDDLRVDPVALALPQGGLSESQQERVRSLAVEVLGAYRDAGCPAPPPLPDEQMLQIMEFAVGGGDMSEYLPLLEEELSVRGEDRRAPGWKATDVAGGRPFRVAIIGAGMSGILVAHRLAQVGIPFVILEKNDDVGGTWLENRYPGCRVDNPSHNYSYSFAQRHDWPFHFSDQKVLLDYFRRCAEAFGVLPHIHFGVEVRSARWDDGEGRWRLVTVDREGAEQTVEADAVVSAVGQLNRPLYPDIEGRDRFAGPSFHSARWDTSVGLAGKRVAVIGTGASAVQFVPEVASEVAALSVFQRTPPWLGPTPDYHEAVSPGQRWLYTHVPGYSEWNRFLIFWKMGDGILEGVRVDPDFEPKGEAVSDTNLFLRAMLTEYLNAEFADRPDLLAAAVPAYPPGAKRLLRDNGIWARTLKRDNVRLVTDPIDRIVPEGVMTADGRCHQADVLIYGTGFQASRFLAPMTVTGRDGVDLHEQWAGDARAYLGITVPGFPNFFCLYGPNTNIVINGSIIYFSECGTRYIVEALRLLLEGGHRDMEVRRAVHDAFNEQVDAANALMAWGWSDVRSWYKNDLGRVSQNWPFTLLEYWQRTRTPDPADYLFNGGGDGARNGPSRRAASEAR